MSTSAHTIRAATLDDVPAIANLLTELNRAEGNSATVDPKKLAEGLFASNRKVDVKALVAVQEDSISAVVLYYRGYDILTAAYGYHLADFVVGEQWRRQGVGRQLFAALAARNLAEGGEWISLTVLRGNRAAQGFYAALGMRHIPVEFYAAGKGILETATLLQN